VLAAQGRGRAFFVARCAKKMCTSALCVSSDAALANASASCRAAPRWALHDSLLGNKCGARETGKRCNATERHADTRCGRPAILTARCAASAAGSQPQVPAFVLQACDAEHAARDFEVRTSMRNEC